MKKKHIILWAMAWFFVCLHAQILGLDIVLTVWNRENAAKTNEPITSGVPFAENVLPDLTKVRMLQNGSEIPAQFRVTARWPNNSIRWLLADFQTNLPAGGSSTATLQTGKSPAAVSGISLTDAASTLTVNTGVAVWSFDKSRLFMKNSDFRVISGGITYTATPNVSGWTVEENGPVKTVVRVEGLWKNGASTLGNNLVRFRVRLFFYRNKSNIRAQLTFQNNNSFGWNYQTPGPVITLSSATFGATLLPSGGSYVFGQGVECTWEVEIPWTGSFAKRESRYNTDGSLRAGYYPPYPIATASPAYYAATGAWGRMVLPMTGFPASIQADFDLFEKLQRAKVILADVQSPSGLTGETVFGHLFQDVNSWNDYGDLKWGGSYGPLSGNHYDWSYGMLLHFLRTGRLEFFDAAHVFARHEIDFDLYHTNENGTAYNYQKHWESRPSHNTADNVFGPGRPSHSWLQGAALYWLLTGDPRGYDCYQEMIEGMRQYVYESFNNEGYINTSEIRFSGWITDTLMVLWRIEPGRVLSTSYGNKTVSQAVKDVLKNVFDREAAAGKRGYVYSGDPPDPTKMQPLMNCYFLEPAIKAYVEMFKNRDAAYATELLGLIKRMTTWLMNITYGGDYNGYGGYRPRQIPYMVDTTLSQQTDGQIPYLLMAANAAGFCYLETREAAYASYMRPAFQDYIRYLGVDAGDRYIDDPSQRTPTSYNSNVYTDTESKIHGWSSRYGQYYLAAEALGQSASLSLAAPNGGETWTVGSVQQITWSSAGSVSQVDLAYSTDSGATYSHVIVSGTANTGSYAWTIPNTPSTSCRVRISAVGNSAVSDTSNGNFTIAVSGGNTQIILDRDKLNFGALTGGTVKTGAQSVGITFSPSASLNWTASSSASWVSVSPASGSGGGSFSVSISPAGLGAGRHTATVTTTAPGASAPQTVAIYLNVLSKGSKPFGVFETPADASTVRSSIPVTGWALDDIGITGVEIWRDPVSGEGSAKIKIGDAVLVEGARPDVEDAYPEYPAGEKAGWGYMLLTYGLPARGMSGTFRISAIATDEDGNRLTIGTRTIYCDNAHASLPFGAIDTPGQGGTASGSAFVNFGWALTPPPGRIPTNGSTITIFIDGQPKGHPTYNDYRSDVAELFPGYLNALGAGGHAFINTLNYSNGVHSISWTVTDDLGRVDGVGSRYFTVRNSGSRTAGTQGKPTISGSDGLAGLSRFIPSHTAPGEITAKRGFETGPTEKLRAENGWFVVKTRKLERLEINLQGPGKFTAAWRDRNGRKTPLPWGSCLDIQTGIFYWWPPPGAAGRFPLVFASEEGVRKVLIIINI